LKKNNFSSHKLPKQQSTSFWSQGILGVKQMPISPFTITILCDAQSTLYSCVISINYAKFHSPKIKTPYVMNFFISFSLFYVKIDQEMLVMNFINLIAHLCRKHHCTQHTLTRYLKNV
jgi:hypothetical protein